MLVRPGEPAARGQVLATLECKSASAQSRAMQQQARALSATQVAIESEAGRLSVCWPAATSRPTKSSAARPRARASRRSFWRRTHAWCALPWKSMTARCARRSMARSRSVCSIPAALLVPAQRSSRWSIGPRARPLDVPEADFALVRPETPVRLHLLATGATWKARSLAGPPADGATRTVHAEIDLDNPSQQILVGTTAELTIGIREPQPATQIPLRTAAVRGEQAALFVVREHHAHSLKIAVLGESGGSLFVAPTLLAGTPVVTEGRALLSDGDPVSERVETPRRRPRCSC